MGFIAGSPREIRPNLVICATSRSVSTAFGPVRTGLDRCGAAACMSAFGSITSRRASDDRTALRLPLCH